jgi:hypothetical protein
VPRVESVERRHPDGTVDSIQRAPVHRSVAAELLEEVYFDELRRTTAGLVWVARDAIRVLGRGPALLRFGPRVDGRRAILGGIFARRASGTISFGSDGRDAWVAVEGFAPLLPLLWSPESKLHGYVGRRFLRRVARGT